MSDALAASIARCLSDQSVMPSDVMALRVRPASCAVYIDSHDSRVTFWPIGFGTLPPCISITGTPTGLPSIISGR